MSLTPFHLPSPAEGRLGTGRVAFNKKLTMRKARVFAGHVAKRDGDLRKAFIARKADDAQGRADASRLSSRARVHGSGCDGERGSLPAGLWPVRSCRAEAGACRAGQV